MQHGHEHTNLTVINYSFSNIHNITPHEEIHKEESTLSGRGGGVWKRLHFATCNVQKLYPRPIFIQKRLVPVILGLLVLCPVPNTPSLAPVYFNF